MTSGDTFGLKTVLVTGANGFIGSYIVSALLGRGYRVHACVRDKSEEVKVNHLLEMPRARDNLKLFSIGDLRNASENHSFDIPMTGCDMVVHAATPLGFNAPGDPIESIFLPAMISTRELLKSIERHKRSVQKLILTSSMSAIAPIPEPPVKNETHWSDPEEQKKRGSWYGATKTEQEILVQEWVKQSKIAKRIPNEFQFVSICPTEVLGPPLNTKVPVSGSMASLKTWCSTLGKSPVPNDSLSLVHVEDCADFHVKALEDPKACGRYICLVESWHWNDILKTIQSHIPGSPPILLCESQVQPTQFDFSRRDSLSSSFRTVSEILEQSIKYLELSGDLPDYR
jgi:nucleoside-diphosphate-sugar epimerase